MALSDENGMNTTMLVSPANSGYYGNNDGFGSGSGWWIILLFILLAGNGWGGNNGFNGQPVVVNDGGNCQRGFDQASIMGGINGIQSSVNALGTQMCNGFGNVQTAICGVNQNISNGFNTAEIAANGRQIQNMQTAFAGQTAVMQGFNQTGTQLADLKYTVATENCADRAAGEQNTRAIIDSQTRGTQAILDKLCALELDGVKNQLAQAQRDNIALQNQVNMAAFKESQAAQNAFISQGFANEVDQLYNRLSNCPVPSTPVYGRTPIFTCPQNVNAGCGCGNGFAN